MGNYACGEIRVVGGFYASGIPVIKDNSIYRSTRRRSRQVGISTYDSGAIIANIVYDPNVVIAVSWPPT
jgi:hypothetical protein